MEYVQNAINKARKEREDTVGEGAAHLKTSVKNSSSRLSEINYTTTRKVNLKDDQLRKNRVIAGFNYDKRAEPYRQLRTQVLQKLRNNNWKTLAITSPGDGAGKTLTAINLAISLSKEVNQTVMLVDLDLRSPGILKTLSIDVEKGLVDVLKGDVTVAEVLVNPGFERLVILPGKADPHYSSELLSSPEMTALLNDLISRYESRIIIFDLPGLLTSDDALAFTPFVDSALLVVEEGVTTEAEIERSLQLLEGTNLLGSLMNKAPV